MISHLRYKREIKKIPLTKKKKRQFYNYLLVLKSICFMKKSQGGGFLWFLLMMKNIPNLFNPQCLKHLLLISGRYCLVKSKGNNFAMHITKIIIYIYTHTHTGCS